MEHEMDTRRLVDQARGILMDRNGLSERDAFAFMQHTAMAERAPLAVIARGIIEGAITP